MSERRNLEKLLESVEHHNRGDPEGHERYLEPYSEDVTVHGAEAEGLDELHAFYDFVWCTVPDLEITVEGAIADGEEVALRYSWKGTHAVTGDEVSLETGLTWYRFEDGKVVERWVAEGTAEAITETLEA
jgi:predicted ester cyclase